MMPLLSLLLLLLTVFVQAAERNASITIDSRVKYQHLTGFGGIPVTSHHMNTNNTGT